MIETFAGQRYLITTLRADATLMGMLPGGIHDSTGRDRTYPFATVTSAASRTVQPVNGRIILAIEHFLVQVYDRKRSFEDIFDALNRVDTLLAYTSGGSVVGALIHSTRRDDGGPRPRAIVEPDGNEYRQMGAYYALEIQST